MKLNSVKGCKVTAGNVEKVLSGCKAVKSCKANPVTGSVLIEYHPESASEESLLQLLKDNGFYQGTLQKSEKQSGNGFVAETDVARILFTKAIEVAAERAILALL